MPPVKNPITNERVLTAQEFTAAARDLLDQVTPVSVEPLDTPAPEIAHRSPAETLMARVTKISEQAGRASVSTAASIDDIKEDVWSSLGGGAHTYKALGSLPNVPLNTEPNITRRVGRGGVLIDRVILGPKFLDVPVHEDGSNRAEIEVAIEKLRQGRGKLFANTRPKK